MEPIKVTPVEIVIVEDNDSFYFLMERTLHEKAEKRNIEIKIKHFASLIPAHRYLETNSSAVSVISTDMSFPFVDGGRITEMFAGVELIAILKELDIKTPIVIYSSEHSDEILQKLKEFEIESFLIELIFNKGYDYDPWAEAVLDLIK